MTFQATAKALDSEVEMLNDWNEKDKLIVGAVYQNSI